MEASEGAHLLEMLVCHESVSVQKLLCRGVMSSSEKNLTGERKETNQKNAYHQHTSTQRSAYGDEFLKKKSKTVDSSKNIVIPHK